MDSHILAHLKAYESGSECQCKKLYHVFQRIKETLERARQEHPTFAIGSFHALAFYGDVVKEITKQYAGWEERMDAELYDLIAVAIRMLNREYGDA